MNDKMRITAWLHPLDIWEGKYGKCRNSEWIRREMARINLGKHKCHVKKQDEHEALYYDDGYYEDGKWVSK